MFTDNMFYEANMGPISGRQDPGGPHFGPMNLAIWVILPNMELNVLPVCCQDSVIEKRTLWAANVMVPNSKVHGVNMGPIWGWQDPGGPHVGPMNLAFWVI